MFTANHARAVNMRGVVFRVGHTGNMLKSPRVLIWIPNRIVENLRKIIGLLENHNMGL